MDDDTKPIAIDLLDPSSVDWAWWSAEVAWPGGDAVPQANPDAVDTVEIELRDSGSP